MSSVVVILLVGSLVAASCALLGSFLVLRKMALLGDAISHAVLPGIVVAFLVSHSRSPLPMLLGAGVLGVLTVFLVELFNRSRRLQEDASIGVVFPALFSLGVILISRYAGQVDLDLDCVLYGEIAYAPLDLLYVGETSWGPRPLWIVGGIFLFDLLLVGALYKELELSTFDAELAATLGFSPVLLHYVLMSAVSFTVVGAFESVGAILVVAMLVVPPATAYLLTDRLGAMLGLAVVAGVLSAVGGYALAYWVDGSIAGAMAVVAGTLFLLALAFSPHHGVLARWRTHRRLQRSLEGQLLLLHLGAEPISPASLVGAAAARFAWPAPRTARALAGLERAGLVVRDGALLRLTPAGERAQQERDSILHRSL